MGLFEQLLLKDSIEIKATPERIWEFFTNLDKNYTTWHPEDHIIFKWVEGKPLEVGSKFYFEFRALNLFTPLDRAIYGLSS